MEAVQKAKQRYKQYPAILAKCGKEASTYATCVMKQDNIKINDCQEEFKLFKSCLRKAAVGFKTRI